MDNCMRMWRWEDAPPEYTQLSQHGGDEDWVMLIPYLMRERGMPMIFYGIDDAKEHRGYVTGLGHTGHHDMPNGDLVVIFAHA